MTKTACIVQARLRSTRLPGKVLLPLPTGRTVLEECLHRCRQIEGVDVVVAALADDEGSDLLMPYVEREQDWVPRIVHRNEPGIAPLMIARGPEHDVLRRYLFAAEVVKADIILRVTSDCPLIEPGVCGMVLAYRAQHDLDYCANNLAVRTVPHGWDCEVFTFKALQAAGFDWSQENREHVTARMREKDTGFSRGHIACANMYEHHWTLDTIDDYIVICNEFNRRIAEAKGTVPVPAAARAQ